MPDAVHIKFFTYVPLHTPEGIARLLDALPRVLDMQPSHWGPDTRTRNSYSRDAMIAEVSGYKSEFYSPGLQRRQPPVYDAYFSAKSRGINNVHFEFKKPRAKDLELIFLLGDSLADALQPELGSVHPIWRLGEESQTYSLAGGTSLKHQLHPYGLKPVAARTWYGPLLRMRIGDALLASSGLHIKDMSWGGVRLDLMMDPWLGDFAALSRLQTDAMSHLVSSGLYGDFTRFNDYQAGSNWTPLPEERSVP